MEEHQLGAPTLPAQRSIRPAAGAPRRRRQTLARRAVQALLASILLVLPGIRGSWVQPALAVSAAAAAASVPARAVEVVPDLLDRLVSVLPISHEMPRYPGRLLGRGLVGEDVRQVQRFVLARGTTLKVDGIYGPMTARAVRQFQRSAGLAVDGIVGPVTWAKGPEMGVIPTPRPTNPTPPAASLRATSPPPTTAAPVTSAAPPTTAATVTSAAPAPSPTTAARPSVTSTLVSTTTAAAASNLPKEQALPAPADTGSNGAAWIVIAATLVLIAALVAVAIIGRRQNRTVVTAGEGWRTARRGTAVASQPQRRSKTDTSGTASGRPKATHR